VPLPGLAAVIFKDWVVAKGYRRVDRDQVFLLPPDMGSWLPAGHLVWFVLDVITALDTAVFHRRDVKAWSGRAAFDPDMLVALLVYGYATGVRSSRKIEALCQVDVAFRVVCAGDTPDHSTLARFRRAHLPNFEQLFAQVLALCAAAGMARVGVVALDGTKIAANASPGANRSEDWLREQAGQIMAEAESIDATEDALFGSARGDELPAEVADPRTRAARIAQCLRQIEADRAEQAARQAAQQQAAAQYLQRVRGGDDVPPGPPPPGVDPIAAAQARLARERDRAAARQAAWQAKADAAAARGHRMPGTAPAPVDQAPLVRRAAHQLEQARARELAGPDGQPAEHPGAALMVATRTPARRQAATGQQQKQQQKQQKASAQQPTYNLTDPDSRLMPTRGGWVQGYNAQLLVCDDHIILATRLVQQTGDVEQFQPMMTTAVQVADRLAAHRPAPDPHSDPQRQTGIGLLLADAGYLSEDNLTAAGPDRLIAVGKRRDQERHARDDPAHGPPPADATILEANAHRLRTPDGAATYRRRGATVEPVIGHVKDLTGLRRFSVRGADAAQGELNLAASATNLLKLHRAGWRPTR
jgi:transposase